jgi:uncharacterized protein (DUF58 family)
MTEGITPSLDELVALRRAVLGRRPPRRGRHGLSGQAPSPMRGRGMEYAESREYANGDDARHIDWRLTARTGRPHTKLFQAERERLTLIVADTAPALYFGTRTRFKSVQAARAGAVAAWAAVRDGDRIGALRGSVREPPIVPASGSRGALRVLDALVRWYAQPPEHDAGFAVALDHADRLLRPGSRLVVLADPLSVLAQPASRWPMLVQHREVVVLLMTDPLERDPPRATLPFFVERLAAAGVASATRRIELDLAAAAQRQRWQSAFSAPLDEAMAILARSGIRARALSTDAPSESWLDLFAGTRAA